MGLRFTRYGPLTTADFVGLIGAGVPCALTNSTAHQKYPITPDAKINPPITRHTTGTATLPLPPRNILCGIQTATINGTNSVKTPVFIALEAVLIAANMVLRNAIGAVISC